MNKKRTFMIYAVLAVLFLALIAYAAISGNRSKVRLKYTPGPYTDAQVNELFHQTTNDLTLPELESVRDVQYLDKDVSRKTVVVTGDSKVVLFNFLEDGTLESKDVRDISPASVTFDALSEADPISKVMEIDPKADFGFMYSGRNDVPRHTYHYTTDGYCVEISYDSNNNIIEVVKNPLDK